MDGSGQALDNDPLDHNVAGKLPEVINIDIVQNGDLILDVTFENSRDTIRSAQAAQSKLGSQGTQPVPKKKTRVAFRVSIKALKGQSKYFEKLLTDIRFLEANDISSAFAALSLKNIKPDAAEAKDLPWIKIRDDDQATRYAYRDGAFADLLRVLHGKEVVTKQVTMIFVTTLAVLADRFDCAAAVSKYLASGLKFKWPVTSRKPVRDEVSVMSRVNEDILRQKILVSWLLNQPTRFQSATKEIIMNGSCRWSPFAEEDDGSHATWWYLQDGLERKCLLIMNT